MKRFVFLALWAAGAMILQAQDINVEIRRMTGENLSGNQKFPVIAENAKGERIYVYRDNNRKAHYFHYKDGKWTDGGPIPGSPAFEQYWFGDIVPDSTGTFHYVCEEADSSMYYSYFKDGVWAPMQKILFRHEATLALAVRSDDTVVLCSALKTMSHKGVTKDVILGFKPKLATTFSDFTNITLDPEGSTMVDVAVDAEDNTWVVYKGGFVEGAIETMQTVLLVLDKANKEIYWKNVSGEPFPAYCWYANVGINGDGKVMVTWMLSQKRSYYSRLLDTKTDQWTEVVPITTGPLLPWPTMYNKIIANGSDFYWIGESSARVVVLYKYDAEHNSWSFLANLSNVGTNWCSACVSGKDLLVSWDSFAQPTACYLTTVSNLFPPPPIKVQSVSNLVVERKFERSFFSGYHFNNLTWEPNPVNTQEGITIAAHHVYRKERTADNTQWTQIAALTADVYSYLDNNIPSGSDYVYAVTCVDSNGNESPIEEPSGQALEATAIPRPESPSDRSIR